MEARSAVANALQSGVPFVRDPWADLGAPLGLSGEAVLAQVRAFSEAGELREISGVLEGSALGHDSALVAARVPPERLEQVGALISACPTVTHNYVRDHAFNLWFTLAMPEEIGLDAALAALSRETGIAPLHPLRRTHTFKIGVRFDLDTMENTSQKTELQAVAARTFDAHERKMLRALQHPLPLFRKPFAALADVVGVDEGELLAFARSLHGSVLRRYVGTFRHRKLGVRGNGMVVWNVPEDRIAEIGERFAEAPEVSHCYARNAVPGFPYSFYTMVHARDEASVRAIADGLAAQVGRPEYAILFSTRELKKVRLRYFLPELDAWWRARMPCSERAARSETEAAE